MKKKRIKTKKSLKLSPKKKKVIMISGGFDPIHIGHIRYIQEAKKLGDKLIVVINNDNWIRQKKGKEFMPEIERKEIIEAISGIDKVIISSHPKNPKDMSVSEEIKKIKPDIFANGGDRDEKNAQDPKSSLFKDINTCKELRIEMVFNVGKGGKVRSSSELLKEYSLNQDKGLGRASHSKMGLAKRIKVK